MASNSLNKIQIIGRLGQDAEHKETAAGKLFMRFSVATDKYDYNSKETVPIWHNCSMFNFGDKNRTEGLHPYMTKGKQVYVEGSMDYWEDDNGVQRPSITVSTVVLLGSKSDTVNSGPQTTADRDDGVPF